MGTFVDGLSSRVHTVAVRVEDDTLVIEGETIAAHWPLPDLRESRDAAHDKTTTFFRTGNEAARLTLRDPSLISDIRDHAPNLTKAERNAGQVRKVLVWAGGAVASVLLIVFVIVPAIATQLAPLVPMERERQLGEAVIEQLTWALDRFGEREGEFCAAPKGLAALDKMTDRLDRAIETDYDFNVRVYDHPMANAFAVPGGNIVLFRGLLKEAKSPEEVAGVLAHEMGHVVNRDPTRLTLQSAGTVGILGLVVGDFSGGAAVLVLTERLVTASYAQDAEEEADRFAFDTLAKAELPSAPLGDFFARFAKRDGDVPEFVSHLLSHPDLSLRARAARDANRVDGAGFREVLSEAEWSDLRAICDQHAKAEE